MVWSILALLCVFGSITIQAFFSLDDAWAIFSAAAPLGMLVIAQSFVLITGNLDLSTESNLIFSAVVAGNLMIVHHWVWWLGLAALLAVSTGIGFVNGTLVVGLRMSPFMATLGVSTALTGLTLVVNQSQDLTGFAPQFIYMGSATIGGQVPVAALFLLVAFAVVHFILRWTRFGRHALAVGSSRSAARNAGVSDAVTIFRAYLLAGLFSGLAAYLVIGRLGATSAAISSGQLFLSIAAAVIGGVSLFGGVGTAMGMLGGLLLMATITQAMDLASLPSQDIQVVTGGVIIVAVLLDSWRKNKLGKALRAALGRVYDFRWSDT